MAYRQTINTAYRQTTAQLTHQKIKQHYLNQGRTEQQWQAVSQNPGKFNKVWRSMLRQPINENPPYTGYKE